MQTITYRQLSESEYEATDGVHTCRVFRAWYRTGGHQWATDVPYGRTQARGATRGAAATKALRLLANGDMIHQSKREPA